jgi:hypothetical protein
VKFFLALSILTALVVAPASAQTPTGMDAMNYYVGNWACLGGPTDDPPVKAVITVAMSGGLLIEHIGVPMQTGMPMVLSQNSAIDSTPAGYTRTEIDNFGSWRVSKAAPFTGNTEDWTDVASYNGTLGHGQTIRTDQNHFTSLMYATAKNTTPNFKATCERQT